MTTQQRIERIANEYAYKLRDVASVNPKALPLRYYSEFVAALKAFAEEQEKDLCAKDEWLEEDGFVLWWSFPITEPPYVGTPLCSDFPGYVTHWTRIKVPSTGEKPE